MLGVNRMGGPLIGVSSVPTAQSSASCLSFSSIAAKGDAIVTRAGTELIDFDVDVVHCSVPISVLVSLAP